MNKDLFALRLVEKRKKAGYKSQTEFAAAYEKEHPTKRRDEAGGNTGTSGILGTIKNYENPNYTKSMPTLDKVDNICSLLGCDIDYLTGRIDEETHDVKFICEYTGLSESAVNMLHSIKSDGFKDDKTLYVLNLLLSDPKNEEFVFNDSGHEMVQSMHNELIDLLYDYLFSNRAALISERKNWPKDKVIFFGSSGFVGLDIEPLFKEHLINRIREELNKYANARKDNGEQK